MIDFGEIVILARKPEDGDRIDAATCYLFRAADGGECLVEGICRAREKPDLLAGDDGNGTRSESLEVARCGRIDLPARSEAAILLAQNFQDSSAHTGIETHFARRGVYSRLSWRMCVIMRNTAEVIEKSGKQFRGAGDLAKGKTVRLHRGNHDTWRPEQRQ